VFFDRDRDRDGLRIRGLPVRHCDTDIAGLFSEYQVDAILALSGVLSNGNADFARRCRDAGVRLMTLDISVKEISAIEAA
jgi:FlaA1/EpsC-like NDP-sugar epimerase